jgi:hypothetical protein
MQAQIGACPNRDNAQLQNRCNPYCPDLVRLFGASGPVLASPRSDAC